MKDLVQLLSLEQSMEKRTLIASNVLYINGPTPAFFVFKQTIQFLQRINVKKCPSVHPVYGARI